MLKSLKRVAVWLTLPWIFIHPSLRSNNAALWVGHLPRRNIPFLGLRIGSSQPDNRLFILLNQRAATAAPRSTEIAEGTALNTVLLTDLASIHELEKARCSKARGCVPSHALCNTILSARIQVEKTPSSTERVRDIPRCLRRWHLDLRVHEHRSCRTRYMGTSSPGSLTWRVSLAPYWSDIGRCPYMCPWASSSRRGRMSISQELQERCGVEGTLRLEADHWKDRLGRLEQESPWRASRPRKALVCIVAAPFWWLLLEMIWSKKGRSKRCLNERRKRTARGSGGRWAL